MPEFEQGTVIFRYWDEQQGLTERSTAFASVEELFALCLQSDGNLLVDRVVVDGKDDTGMPHTVTLRFQSIAQRS